MKLASTFRPRFQAAWWVLRGRPVLYGWKLDTTFDYSAAKNPNALISNVSIDLRASGSGAGLRIKKF